MKKSLLVALFVFSSFSLFAAEWTVMFYLNGDNNLDPYIKVTLNRLHISNDSEEVNVLVMVDTSSDGDSKLYTYKNGLKKTIEKDIEYDMGNPETMARLVRTGLNSFAAKRYALVVYTHGRGILNLPVADGTSFNDDGAVQNLVMSPDDQSSTILYEEDILKALKKELNGRRLDLLVFNSCLIGNTGIYLTLAPIAKSMIASEFLIGLDRRSTGVSDTRGIGIDLAALVRDLKDNPNMMTSMVAKNIVDRFYEGYIHGFFNPADFEKPRIISSTLAHYDFRGYTKLKMVLKELADQFMLKSQDDPSYMDALYHALLQFRMVGGVGYYDLGSLAKAFKSSMNLPAAEKLIDLMYESRDVVSYIRSVHVDSDLSGLSIFFPITSLSDFENDEFINFYSKLDFDKEIGWSRVLKQFAKDYPAREYHIRLRMLKLYLAGEKVIVLPGQNSADENEYQLLNFVLWERFYLDLEARNYEHMLEQVSLISTSQIESPIFINYRNSIARMLKNAAITDDDTRLKAMISMLENI